MRWTTPTFEVVKMDAEIGSYQPDGDDGPDTFASAEPTIRAAHGTRDSLTIRSRMRVAQSWAQP